MFGVLAKTLMDATRLPNPPERRNPPRSWYGEDLRHTATPKRWEDWK